MVSQPIIYSMKLLERFISCLYILGPLQLKVKHPNL